jgi:3-oxoacyl-[acyl-carrier protein] reductase
MRALLLGASGAIGSAVLHKFLKEDPSIEISALSSDRLDLSDPRSVNQFFDANGTNWDVVVYSAGWNKPKNIQDVTDSDIDKAMQINVLAFIEIMQQCIYYWGNGNEGRVVAIGSLYGNCARQDRLAYTTSKHALLGAIKSLAIDLAPYNVLVNSVSPGYINTPMTNKNNTEGQLEVIKGKIPLNRLGTPEEVADLVYFLCTQNTYITGQDFVIDGGYSAGGYNE